MKVQLSPEGAARILVGSAMRSGRDGGADQEELVQAFTEALYDAYRKGYDAALAETQNEEQSE